METTTVGIRFRVYRIREKNMEIIIVCWVLYWVIMETMEDQWKLLPNSCGRTPFAISFYERITKDPT